MLSMAESRHIFLTERPGICFSISWKAVRKLTEWNIRAEGTVIAGELEQGITKIILIKGRVPSPAGIRVRIVSGCGG